jgi:hypothetical protein
MNGRPWAQVIGFGTISWIFNTSHLLHVFLYLGGMLLCQTPGPLLSSSSSLPSHVRKVPFLPLTSRHAYFLIERWLPYNPSAFEVTKMIERTAFEN